MAEQPLSLRPEAIPLIMRRFCLRKWHFLLAFAGVVTTSALAQSVNERKTESPASAAKSWTADNGNVTYSNPLFYEEFEDPDVIGVGRECLAIRGTKVEQSEVNDETTHLRSSLSCRFYPELPGATSPCRHASTASGCQFREGARSTAGERKI